MYFQENIWHIPIGFRYISAIAQMSKCLLTINIISINIIHPFWHIITLHRHWDLRSLCRFLLVWDTEYFLHLNFFLNFYTQNFFQNFLSGSKFIWANQIFLTKNFFWFKIFSDKISFLDKNFFRQKYFLHTKLFLKFLFKPIFFFKKSFWTQNLFGHTHFLDPTFLRPKIFCEPKIYVEP